MSAFISWVRANSVWLQSILQAGVVLGTDFGLKLTQDQQGDLFVFTALVLGVSAHVASQGQNVGPAGQKKDS